jgi:acyl-CoA dehydrogenase
MSDIAMGTLGGSLKIREKLTGRYADVLSWMYMAAATIRRYEAEGRRPEHRAVFDWAMQHCMAEIQKAFDGIFANFDVPVIGFLFRGPLAFWSRVNSISHGPSDRLGHAIAQLIQAPGAVRDSLTTGIVVAAKPGDHSAKLEEAFRLAHASAAVLARIHDASKRKVLPKKRATQLVKEAVEAKVITADEAKMIETAKHAVDDAIQVDSFTLDEFRPNLLDVRKDSAVG